MKNRATLRIGLKNAIHHDAVKKQMRVEQRRETVDEDHGAEVGRCTGAGTVVSQYPLDGGQEYTQCGVQNRRIVLQVIAQALGKGSAAARRATFARPPCCAGASSEHPLAHRQTRDDVVGQMRRRLDHAAGNAGRADAAALAGVSDQEVVPAVGAAGTGETMSEDAAPEVEAEFPLGDGGCACPGAILLKRQPGGFVIRDQPFGAELSTSCPRRLLGQIVSKR